MSEQDMTLIEWRRWQADAVERNNPPKAGDWNWPEILRADANEIERLEKEVERLRPDTDALAALRQADLDDEVLHTLLAYLIVGEHKNIWEFLNEPR